MWAVGALVYAMAVGDPAPAELATEPRERLVAAIGRRTGSEALSHAAHRALDPDPSRRPSVHQVVDLSIDGGKCGTWIRVDAWLDVSFFLGSW